MRHKMSRTRIVKAVLLSGALGIALGMAPSVRADTWQEVGDAGPLPTTAQVTVGVNPLTEIRGSLLTVNDADMYLINITNPATFSALASGITLLDPQLSLFRVNGMGVAHNDDIIAGLDRRSRLTGPLLTALTPGLYYLAITGFDNDPVSLGGRIFPNDEGLAGMVVGPTGPGGGQPIIGYTNEGLPPNAQGTYTIALTGAGFAQGVTPIPEPATMVLLGTGLVGVGAIARKRRKANKG